MTSQHSRAADAAATAALFVVILGVSIVLALTTDLPFVARGAIAVVVGVVCAALTFIAVKRRTSR